MNKKSKWTPVNLEGPICNGELEGLIGIEELSSYDANTVFKNKKKRKLSQTEVSTTQKPKTNGINKQHKEAETDAFVRNPKIVANKIKVNDGTSKKKNKKRKLSQTEISTPKKPKTKGTGSSTIKEQSKEIELGAFVRSPKFVAANKLKTNDEISKKKKDSKQKTKKVKQTKTTEKKLKIEIGETIKDDAKQKYSVDDLTAWSIVSLPEPLLQALADLGFTKPTIIQELSLPPAILGRRDILGAAETGSGKTLAFGLPILAGILKLKEEAKRKSLENAIEDELIDNQHDADDDTGSETSENESTEDYNGGFEEGDDGNSDVEDSDVQETNDSDMSDFEEGDENVIDDEDSDVEDNESGQEMNDSDMSDLEESDENVTNGENDEDSDESGQETNDSDLSDFEEREENIETLDAEGMGCVRSIDNIQMESVFPKSKPVKPLYALILTPTRELAMQVKNHLIAAAKYTDIKVAVILGGMAAVKQERILRQGPEIVVATPGRLWELIQEGNAHLSQVDNISYLAIDETDRMVEKHHYEEFHQLLERVNSDEEKRKLRQNFVFSATLTLVHDLPQHLHNKKHTKVRNKKKINKMTPEQKLKSIIEMLGISDPKVIDVTEEKGTANTLTECRISCALQEKDYYVYYFLQRHPGRTLIFCNSIGCVKRLATLLTMLGCSTMPLHASMQQRQRLKNLEGFRDNPLGVLVATDVAARGLDIPKVEHVLHYQTPRTSESYVHRSGRTARASEEGITVLLIEPNEVHNYLKVCRTLGRTHDLPSFPVADNMLHAVKQRVNLARDLDKLELLSRRTSSETGWLQKASKDMDIIIEETNFQYGHVDKEQLSKTRLLINRRRKELASLLARPIFPRGFSMKYPTASGELNIPLVQGDQSNEKAVNIMKNAIENCVLDKKTRPRKLFTKKNKPANNKTDKNNSKSSFKPKNKKYKKNKKH